MIGGLLALAMIIYVATSFTYVQEFEAKLASDLEHVFNSVKKEFLSFTESFDETKYSHTSMTNFYNELDDLEDTMIGPGSDHYH